MKTIVENIISVILAIIILLGLFAFWVYDYIEYLNDVQIAKQTLFDEN